MSYRLPEPLAATHDLEGFVCASSEQWHVRRARQSMATGTTRVFVVTPTSNEQVVAYYAWTMAQIELADAPVPAADRAVGPARCAPRAPGPRSRRGAVARRDARVAALSEEIGCRGLLVHCESEQARKFYLHLMPEFESSPTDGLHLVLLLKDIKRTLRRGPR